jgi:hypothetical protein
MRFGIFSEMIFGACPYCEIIVALQGLKLTIHNSHEAPLCIIENFYQQRLVWSQLLDGVEGLRRHADVAGQHLARLLADAKLTTML